MKARLSESGLRLRLVPEELAQLAKGPLTLKVPAGPAVDWEFTLSLHEGAAAAEIHGTRFHLRLPRAEALRWMSERELEWDLDLGRLRVSVEKDARPHRK